MSDFVDKQMSCHQAQLTMALYMEADPSLTTERRRAFEGHLQSCVECAEEYEDSKFVIGLVKKYWPVSEEALALIEKSNHTIKPRMSVEEGWKDLLRRCPDLAPAIKHHKRQRLLGWSSGVAACLAIGVSISWTFSTCTKPEIIQKPIAQQVVFVPKPSVRIELVSKNGNILVPAKQQIASANELKTLVINNEHHLMMNTNTILAVEPLIKNSNIGCLVKLVSGQIYTHVEHDGNPFIVDTANGKAVITGTTFDIKATESCTTLVVSEGTVQFESENGVVNVAAGQISKTVGQSAPSMPLSCNTAELTAWATGYKPRLTLVQVESNTDPWYLPLSLGIEPIVLEETDYDHWIEQKRDWFKQEFPWIFQLKEALAKEDIETDYPELLLQSDDVWQFVYLEGIPARFSVIDPNSLLKAVSNYGFDKQWLLENITAAKPALENPALSRNSFTGLKTFGRWLEYLDETKGLTLPTPIYSYHASKYLTETRSLIWFIIRDGQYDLTDEERIKVLALLQEEVIATCQCQNEVLYPWEKEKQSCDDIGREPVDSVIGHIETIKAIEKQIVKYEIIK